MAEYIDLETLLKSKDWQALQNYDKARAKAIIQGQPTADVVEVRHGYWDDNIIGFCNVCMECGAIVERTAIKSHTGALNYCPNCGAKMDGKGEGE